MADFQFTADNVFSGWDLNPLAAALGIPRDTLALERDAFLQPLYAAYRAASLSGGFHAAADDYSLFNDPAFQAYARTGALPKSGYVTPAPPPTSVEMSTVFPVPPGIPDIRTASSAGTSAGINGLPVTTAGIGGGLDFMTIAILAAMGFAVYYLIKHHGGK